MRKAAAIDPAAWLAGQDIKGYLDAAFPSDPLALGREALALADGDLLTACRQREGLRAEAVLAWLYQQIGQQPEDALGVVLLAALVLEESCEG